MYKIYINDKILVLTKPGEDPLKTAHLRPIIYESMDSILENLKDVEKIKGWTIQSEDIDSIFKEFSAQFKFIEAGGGLVQNDQNEYLFIFRKGKWDLPKGKLDEGERIDECALREVEEECGITQVELTAPLVETYHIYKEKGRDFLKKTSWFAMKCPNQPLTPQLEEGITEAIWLPKDRFSIIEQNTYPLIKEVIRFS